jgi:hypothetical protein
MQCPECLTENDIMIKLGYCVRSYIPGFLDCTKHGPKRYSNPGENYLTKLPVRTKSDSHLGLPPYNRTERSNVTKAINHRCSIPNNIVQKQHADNSGENYLIRLHLNLPPYNRMERSEAIEAIKRHCGF